MLRVPTIVASLLPLLANVAVGVAADEPAGFDRRFLERHCLGCHAGETPEGGLDLERFSTDLADADVRRRWGYLYDRVRDGEMPPAAEPRPDPDEAKRFLDSLGEELTRADRMHREVVLRRLNRREYENTVRDLFGIEVDLTRLLPDDGVDEGFDTRATALSLSAEQMVRYLEAADVVLDEVFGPPRRPERVQETWNARDTRALRSSVRVSDEGITLFNSDTCVLRNVSAPGPGTYRLRFEARAVQTNEPVVVRVDGGITMRIAPHVEGFREIPADRTTTIEIETRAIERFDNLGLTLVDGFPHSRVPQDYAGPGLFVGEITVEGPLEPWPPPSRRRLLGEVDPERGTIDDVRAVLARTLPAAFRRSTSDADAAPFVRLAERAFAEGRSFESALRRALKGVLSAPEFLFLEESLVDGVDADVDVDVGRPVVDDFALASRLAFFLWSSQPDEELRTWAERGTLHRPDVLRGQVERLLADPRSRRFVESFTDQWLRLRDVDFTVPDRRLYPEYDQQLRAAMLGETRGFFRALLDDDLDVANFVDSRFVVVNEPLADFYGIEGVEGLEFHRVPVPEGSPRGGVLTQASVLKVSADGTRTSPVLRGAWILKHFYGTPSPPPPPSVAAVEPDVRGATTIREQLALHRDHESCNRCHRRIDPPGFALESFDVIGGHREWYRVRGEGGFVRKPRHPRTPNAFVLYRRGPDVDSSGRMPDGRTFDGVREYKRLLLADDTAMPRALARLLLSYALGRELGFSDRAEVERIVNRAKENGSGLRTLIHEVVRSPLFRAS